MAGLLEGDDPWFYDPILLEKKFPYLRTSSFLIVAFSLDGRILQGASSQVIFICWIKLPKLNRLLFSGEQKKKYIKAELDQFTANILKIIFPTQPTLLPFAKNHRGKLYKKIGDFFQSG